MDAPHRTDAQTVQRGREGSRAPNYVIGYGPTTAAEQLCDLPQRAQPSARDYLEELWWSEVTWTDAGSPGNPKYLRRAVYARLSTLREVYEGRCLSGARSPCGDDSCNCEHGSEEARKARAPTSREQAGTTGVIAMDLQADKGSDAKQERIERANGALFAQVRPHYRPPEER